MPLPRTEMSAPKTGYFGTDPGFKSGVGAIFGRNRRRDSPLCSRHVLPGPGLSPPPVTPCAAQVPVRLCLRQSPGTASVRWCGIRYALPTARLATPRLLPGAAATPGSKRTILRAPMALKIVRLAAADDRNGRRRCPQALPDVLNDLASTLITRESRQKSYIPAVTAQAHPESSELLFSANH